MKNFYSVISDGGLLLSPDDAQRARDNGMAYLPHYAQLARTAMEHGRFQWSVVNKFHFFGTFFTSAGSTARTQRPTGVTLAKIS